VTPPSRMRCLSLTCLHERDQASRKCDAYYSGPSPTRDSPSRMRRPNLTPPFLTLCECEGPLANVKTKMPTTAEAQNLQLLNLKWSVQPLETHLRPPGPQPKVPTYPKTLFKLVPIFKTPQTTSNQPKHIGSKPKFSKSFEFRFWSKTQSNHVRMTWSFAHTYQMTQRNYWNSQNLIPTPMSKSHLPTRNRRKSNFTNSSLNLLWTSKTYFDHASKSQITSRS